MNSLLRRFSCDERGTASIEYAFLALLIAVAIIAAVTALGGQGLGILRRRCRRV
jgi:Flp pilus assembly pilin Flp